MKATCDGCGAPVNLALQTCSWCKRPRVDAPAMLEVTTLSDAVPVYVAATQAGLLTLNEVRRLEGLS